MTTAKNNTPLLPVCLMLKDKECLVVGGGKVALRKTKSLLDAEASVTLVSPNACEEITKLAKEGKINYIQRDFLDNDLNNMFLVFATTDSEDVNKKVLELCNREKTLCAAVDINWKDGDLISPASFRKNNITVSVSTGGNSCTKARDIKNALAEMLDKLDL